MKAALDTRSAGGRRRRHPGVPDLPHAKELAGYFRNADHIDVKRIAGRVELRRFIAAMLSYYPRWLILLYHLRELLVVLLGLERHAKPDALPSITPEALAFRPGEMAAFFVVRQAEENRYWVAETPPDNHLKAVFGVSAGDPVGGRTTFHVFTAVTYIHWRGPVYFNLIRPFHHLVVARMMRAGIEG